MKSSEGSGQASGAKNGSSEAGGGVGSSGSIQQGTKASDSAVPRLKVSDAAQAVFNLHSDEASYCACVTLFNLSKLEDCVSLAGTCAVPLLVELLARYSDVRSASVF